MYIDKIIDPETESAVYALPVRVTNKIITIWVMQSYARYYTRDEAPDFLKQRLAMISTCDNKHLANDDLSLVYPDNENLLKTLYFISRLECPTEFKHIGWRVNNKYYYVVVSEEERSSMRGTRT
jgi:hypothetical protein